RPLPDGAAQGLLYRIFDDVAVLVFDRPKMSDVGGDGLAQEPIHQHVLIFGVDPKVYSLDMSDVAGLVADDATRITAEGVFDTAQRQMLAPLGLLTFLHRWSDSSQLVE